jgi:large subunit ribosomal protein L25
MEQIELKAEPRSVTGKAVRHLRRAGLVPAIIYGHHTQPIPIQVVERELSHVLHSGGASQLVALIMPGADQPRMSLVRDIQRHTTNRTILHVDFQEVVMTEEIQTTIPLVFEGEPAIVRLGDGIMLRGLDEIEVECLPGDLVASIRVDLKGLEEIDATIHVRDLQIPLAIKVLADPDEVVAKILPSKAVEEEEEEAVEEEAEAPAEVAVITEQKAEQRRAERPARAEEEEEE